MKIHFILAPPVKKPKLGELSEGRIPPLGILYLAAYIREKIKDISLKVTDGTVEGYEKTLREIKEFEPDILCVSTYTLMALGAYKLINEIKSVKNDMFVIIGGPHVTALPDEALKKSSADLAVIGEGEVTLHELVVLFSKGLHNDTAEVSQVDGLAYRTDSENFEYTPVRQHIADLDSIPFPARDLIDMEKYKGWYINKEASEAAVFFARGCPYNCTFCSNIVWKKCKPYIRMRSPENIVDEIELLVNEYGIKEIYDCSDEINSSLEYAASVAREIKNRDLGIVWKTSIRAKPLTEDLVKLLAESGCWYVLIGIESANEEVIKGIKKYVTLDEVEKACKLLKKYGIKIQGLFMLYNVWEEGGEVKFETDEMIEKTFKYITMLVNRKLLDYIGWSVTIPYPGSELYKTALKFDLIKDEYKDRWDYWLSSDSYVMKLPGITAASQIRMKTRGSMLRARMLLKQGDFKLKDLSWLLGKAIKLVANEIRGHFRSGE